MVEQEGMVKEEEKKPKQATVNNQQETEDKTKDPGTFNNGFEILRSKPRFLPGNRLVMSSEELSMSSGPV